MTLSPDPVLERIAPSLAAVRGVVAVVLGGSRARGVALPSSDYDIGLYFGEREPLDTQHLLQTAQTLSDRPTKESVTAIGEWGPRIVGGAWLSIAGRKVDLLYRCVEHVRGVIGECRNGQIRMDYQPGHPHGFCSATWMGEVAICKPLYDPQCVIAGLKSQTSPYPDALREVLLRTFLWEILFSIENGELAVARGDPTHIAGCAYRALGCIGQVLFAVNRRYHINEKGALTEAAGFDRAPADLTSRIQQLWTAIGTAQFPTAFADLRALETDVRALASADA